MRETSTVEGATHGTVHEQQNAVCAGTTATEDCQICRPARPGFRQDPTGGTVHPAGIDGRLAATTGTVRLSRHSTTASISRE